MSNSTINKNEIDEFFKKDYFSQEELDLFKENIKKNCKHNSELVGILNIVNLNLLKFKLQNVVVLENKKSPTKQIHPKPVVSKKSKKTIPGKNESLIDFLRDKTIYKILTEIPETENKERFLNLLKEKGYYKGRINCILTEAQFSSIEKPLKKILESVGTNIGSKIITRSRLITQNRSISKSNTVYDKIYNSNGPGKLIYIRSK